MPIFWRYLLIRYVRILALSVVVFIALLVVSRLEEIASVAALGAPWKLVFLFTLYQIPYILPIALPISCLISAIILFSNLSRSQELLALRASGIPLPSLLFPVILVSLFLSFSNFFITSELATRSHLASRQMITKLTSINPLVLLKEARIAKLKGAYVQMEPIPFTKGAKNLLVAVKNSANSRLMLLVAKKVDSADDEFIGEQVSVISSLPAQTEFDHLLIENEKLSTFKTAQFAGLFSKSGWKIANDHLAFPLLRLRIQQSEKGSKIQAKAISEIFRRTALGLAPLTFTLLGCAFGIEIGRMQSKKGILFVVFGSAFTLLLFFIAKENDNLILISSSLYLLPHLALLAFSFRALQKINRGIET